MEKYRFLWSLLLVSLSSILFSCSDDDEVTGPLTIKTGLLKEIGYTTAVCGGEISGGSGIGNRGVCWSTDVQPTVKDKHTTDGSGRGEHLVPGGAAAYPLRLRRGAVCAPDRRRHLPPPGKCAH